MTKVFFVMDFCHLVTKNKMGCDWFKGFFRKRKAQSHHFLGKQKLNLPYLDHRFLYVASIMLGLKKKLLSSLTCSQIWLTSLVAHCQFTNLMKLSKNLQKLKTSNILQYFRKIEKSLWCV
jgi:hypothetical protein